MWLLRSTGTDMPWIANVGETHAEQFVPDDNTVVISITDTNRKARLNCKGFKDMLRLQFQDYDGIRGHPEDAVLFTPNMAARIVRLHGSTGIMSPTSLCIVRLESHAVVQWWKHCLRHSPSMKTEDGPGSPTG